MFSGGTPSDLTTHVHQWIHSIGISEALQRLPPGSSKAEVEIEVRLGIVRDRNTMARISLPVATETVLPAQRPPFNLRFESGMTAAQYDHLKGKLDDWSTSSQHIDSRIAHERHQEDDFYFPFFSQGDDGKASRDRRRVTKDSQSGQLKETASIVKRRLGNLDVHCPQHSFDYRLSVSLEFHVEGPGALEPHVYCRKKDRWSYLTPSRRLDLTKVTTPSDPMTRSREQVQYEVELELVKPPQQVDTHTPPGLGMLSTSTGSSPADAVWVLDHQIVGDLLNDVKSLVQLSEEPDVSVNPS